MAECQCATGRQLSAAFLGYGLILLFLFHRLFLGEVLSPGANMLGYSPLDIHPVDEIRPYLNDIQGDVWRQFSTYAALQKRGMEQGRLPLWNPHILFGMPIHSNGQSGLLQPFHAPYYFGDYWSWNGPIKVLELLIAALGMFCLGRRLTLAVPAAFVVGLVWSLGSVNVHWLQSNLTHATLWLPILLFALDGILCAPSLRSIALASLAAGMLQLASHPESQFLCGVIAGIFVLARISMFGLPLASSLKRCFCCLMAMFSGLAIAAAALLPLAFNLVESAEWKESLIGKMKGLPIEELRLFLAPDFFGRPRAGHPHFASLNFTESCCWFGSIALLLAVIALLDALFQWRNDSAAGLARFTRVIGLFGVLALLIACDVAPFREVMNALPLFRSANMLRMLLVVQFAGAWLAGIGLDKFLNSETPPSKSIVLVVVVGFVSLRAWLMWECLKFPLPPFDSALGLRICWHDLRVRNWGGLVLAVAGSFAVIVAGLRPLRSGSADSPAIRNVLLFLLAGDLLWYAWDLTPTCPRSLLDPPVPAVANFAKAAGDQRLAGTDEVLVPNLAVHYGFRDLRGYELPTPQRIGELFQQLRVPLGLIKLPSQMVFPKLDPQWEALLNHTGVRFLFTDQREPHPYQEIKTTVGPSWKLIQFVPNHGFVYENPNPSPRAWIAQSARESSSKEALTSLLDPRKDLRVSSNYESVVSDAKVMVPATAQGAVRVSEDHAERVVLETDSETGGLVVLSERYATGWSVTVDGVAAQPLIVEFLFRGVVVQPGQHKVEWRYECPGLKLGIWISVVSTVIAIGCLRQIR